MNKSIKMKDVEDFIQGRFGDGLGDIKVLRGRSLNEICMIDGIPFFWFYKRYLLEHVLPRPLNVFEDLTRGRKLSLFQKSRLSISSYVLKKYLLFQEQRKIQTAAKKKQYSGSRKALFLTYPDHLRKEKKLYRIQGIIDCFNRDKMLEPLPLFATQLSSSKKISPRLCTLYQYCDEEIMRKAVRQADVLAKRWLELDKNSLDLAMSLEGINLRPYLSPVLSLFMSREFLSIALMYYETCKKIIKKENAAITFISGQNGMFERCMAAASKTQGIPCILLPHGFAIGNLPARDVLDNMYIAVFSKTTASLFIDSGVPKQQIRITGPAMYDDIINYKNIGDYGKKKITEFKKNNGAEKNILLLTQPLIEDNFMSPENYFRMVQRVLREMTSISDARIIVKLHPREKGIKKYEKIAEKIEKKTGSKRISIRQKGELNLLYDLLSMADLVVNFYSTTCVLEASILNVPSITFPFNGKANNKYGSFDPSLYVWKMKDIKPAIEQLLDEPALLREKRQEMVQEFCTFMDGKSSERVVQWAYERINKNF